MFLSQLPHRAIATKSQMVFLSLSLSLCACVWVCVYVCVIGSVLVKFLLLLSFSLYTRFIKILRKYTLYSCILTLRNSLALYLVLLLFLFISYFKIQIKVLRKMYLLLYFFLRNLSISSQMSLFSWRDDHILTLFSF